MKAVVVGSGGWGTALSMVLCDNGHDVTLWSHDPAKAAEMTKTRENSKLKGVRLPDSLKISGDLNCLKGAELVISATPSFAVRETGKKIAPYLTPETVLVSVSKGIERDTNLRMSQILTEVTGNICKVAALSGPSHAEEVSIRMPTGCVSACPDLKVARLVQDAFMNDYFRVYTSEDIVGVELSAAMKNVVALACGVCDGMGYQDNTKALLMTRAMAELTRLGEKLGGTGTVGDGSCNISLGTSGTIFISSMTFGVDANNALHAFAHADGHYHLMGCMLSAASCNKWWLDDIIGTGDYAKEQEGITDEMLGSNHVFYLPYLMGERSPHNNPLARATFTGMTMDTTRTDMTQAVLEGVAFAIRDSFEVAKSLGMKITETKICGGGAKSPLWRKMIANILNIRVCVLDKEEGPSLGAAMLAAVGTGAYETVEAAAGQIVHVVDTIEPDAEIAARYEEKYRQFQQIYPALKPVFDSIAQSSF